MEPDSPVKRQRRVTEQARQEFRQTLIDIAKRVFLTEGYAAVTIRRIASEAGVTAMTFYWYFDNKEALLTVIWDDILGDVAAVCEAASAGAADPRRRVLDYFDAFLGHWLTHREHFRFVFASESQGADFVRLRSALTRLPGASRHLANFARLTQACAPKRAEGRDAVADAAKFTTVAMYKAFGFLHCAITLFDYAAEDAAFFKQLLMQEMAQALACWGDGDYVPQVDGREPPFGRYAPALLGDVTPSR